MGNESSVLPNTNLKYWYAVFDYLYYNSNSDILIKIYYDFSDITSQSAFSPEPATQSRSPFSTSQAYSPSSISGNVGTTTSTSTGSCSNIPHFSNLGNLSGVSTNMPAAMSTGTRNSSIPLNPTLTETQMVRLAAAAEE